MRWDLDSQFFNCNLAWYYRMCSIDLDTNFQTYKTFKLYVK